MVALMSDWDRGFWTAVVICNVVWAVATIVREWSGR